MGGIYNFLLCVAMATDLVKTQIFLSGFDFESLEIKK